MTPPRSNTADEPAESARPGHAAPASSSSSAANGGATLGIVWALAVLAFYLFYNHAYFAQKIATFGRFLLAGGA